MNNYNIDPQQKEELKSLIMERVRIQTELKRTEEKAKVILEQTDKKISNILFVNGLNEFSFYANSGYSFTFEPKILKVKKVINKVIKWDIDALRKKINKESFENITHSTYEIIKIDKLINLLKAAGVNPKEFKDCIKVTRTVDVTKLDSAIELGQVKKSDLSGCYAVHEKNRYFRYTLKDDQSE